MKLTRVPEVDQPVSEPIKQRKTAEEGPFRLQVDRQTKASFATFEAAKAAALVIKKGHPNLQVAIHDGVASVNTTIELPSA
jgi:hypothetical protein